MGGNVGRTLGFVGKGIGGLVWGGNVKVTMGGLVLGGKVWRLGLGAGIVTIVIPEKKMKQNFNQSFRYIKQWYKGKVLDV